MCIITVKWECAFCIISFWSLEFYTILRKQTKYFVACAHNKQIESKINKLSAKLRPHLATTSGCVRVCVSNLNMTSLGGRAYIHTHTQSSVWKQVDPYICMYIACVHTIDAGKFSKHYCNLANNERWLKKKPIYMHEHAYINLNFWEKIYKKARVYLKIYSCS